MTCTERPLKMHSEAKNRIKEQLDELFRLTWEDDFPDERKEPDSVLLHPRYETYEDIERNTARKIAADWKAGR